MKIYSVYHARFHQFGQVLPDMPASGALKHVCQEAECPE